MSPQLFLCILTPNPAIAQQLPPLLSDNRYHLNFFNSVPELRKVIDQHLEEIDCLIISKEESILPLFNQLYEQATLLPTVLIDPHAIATEPSTSKTTFQALFNQDSSKENKLHENNDATYHYHSAELCLNISHLDNIQNAIDQAITQFLSLAPSCLLPTPQDHVPSPLPLDNSPNLLLLQQRRLAEKLKERLGYLGVYYKRNPHHFYRNFSPEDKAELREQLMADYREIILNYFSEASLINSLIDQFVNEVFFADLSISQILEIHMELMDDFAQQLKLAGRSDDILLDYRLTLIDILAHLGEMYRRSIPREEIPFPL